MKTISNLLAIQAARRNVYFNVVTATVLLLFSCSLSAQTFSYGNPALFGIDGDLIADKRLNGSFVAAGSHDWFTKKAGSGAEVFDTVGTTTLLNKLKVGTNEIFSKKMKYEAYSVKEGKLMLDGTYGRDYFGIGTSNLLSDKTVFVSTGKLSNKTFENPANWTTILTGDVIPNKVDIIDSYIHMRRNGNSIQIGNPSNLVVYFGASTLGTDGERFIDFELYKNRIVYDAIGKFVDAGATATGGRDIWEFNADGSIKEFGNISLSFAFNSSSVNDISIYIWVPYTTINSVIPLAFNFVKSEFHGVLPFGGFGWVKIQPKVGATLPAYGAVNTASVAGPQWGTSSKDLGDVNVSNYYSSNYGVGQFAEAAIDLTLLGVDPALVKNFGKCSPPYRRVLIKSRSSNSFSSALQDFSGPFEFLDAPTINATIANPGVLSCNNPTLTIQPANNIIGANYIWTTSNGNFVSGANTNNTVINKPGKYFLTASLYEGCAPTTDSILIAQDVYKPVSSATYSGVLSGNEEVTLRGGDPAASNYITEFGGSKGLLWKWTGPNGFNSTSQNPTTDMAGIYTLTVTETRNGCTSSASTEVSAAKGILPLEILSFHGQANKDHVLLTWSVSENETGERFEIQKSNDGRNYSSSGLVFTTSKTGTESYSYNERTQLEGGVYYKIKLINKDNRASYSKVVFLKDNSNNTTNGIKLAQNPIQSQLAFSFNAESNSVGKVNLYNMAGVKIYSFTINIQKGTNTIVKPVENNLIKGTYILEVTSSTKRTQVKVTK